MGEQLQIDGKSKNLKVQSGIQRRVSGSWYSTHCGTNKIYFCIATATPHTKKVLT